MAAQQATHGDHSGVTVLGLGKMGTALAEALLSGGYRTTVWNRTTTGRADDLVGKGAARADTVSDAVAAGQLVIVCVSDYDSARQVLDGGGAAPWSISPPVRRTRPRPWPRGPPGMAPIISTAR